MKGGEYMKNQNRVLVPITEAELDRAYGVRCNNCDNCDQVNEIGLGPTCCKNDCLLGLAGSFISKSK